MDYSLLRCMTAHLAKKQTENKAKGTVFIWYKEHHGLQKTDNGVEPLSSFS